jgi:hypothetical protein
MEPSILCAPLTHHVGFERGFVTAIFVTGIFVTGIFVTGIFVMGIFVMGIFVMGIAFGERGTATIVSPVKMAMAGVLNNLRNAGSSHESPPV